MSTLLADGMLLVAFGTPMVVSPLAGALSDRIGRRPIMVSGLALQALGFAWVAARGSLHTSWIELVTALRPPAPAPDQVSASPSRTPPPASRYNDPSARLPS